MSAPRTEPDRPGKVTDRCAAAIMTGDARSKAPLPKSPVFAAALAPKSGDKMAALIARTAHTRGLTTQEVAQDITGLITAKLDAALCREIMPGNTAGNASGTADAERRRPSLN